MRLHRYFVSGVTGWLLFWGGLALAQTPSHIERVTLYAGSAEITRVANASAGSSYVLFDCIPGNFNRDSVRATAAPSSRIGDIRVDVLSPARTKACRHSPEEDRVKALEDQLAAEVAEKDANDEVANYIKARGAATEKQNAPDAKSFISFTDGLRQTAQNTFARRQTIERKIEDLNVELQTARQERARVVGDAQEFVSVRVAVQAGGLDQVRLIYTNNRAGWSASYRASLDSTTGTVLLERNALVAQATGEPWSQVHLTLSTGQPTRSNVVGPNPSPRPVGYQERPAESKRVTVTGANLREADVDAPAAAQFSAPAPAAAAPSAKKAVETPLFDVNEFQGGYVTSFDLGGGVTLPADGQKITLSLGSQTIRANLLVRSVPQSNDKGAYLIANAEPLQGIWPRGSLQLLRDGAVIGVLTSWQAQSNDPFSLSFGPDDQVIVSVDSSINTAGTAGLFGDSMTRHFFSHYSVSNRHSAPVDVEIIESSPVPNSDKLTVAKKFTPEPSVTDWHKLPGVVAWDAQLAAGESREFRADYDITAPKDGKLIGW